jgi:putative hydrolase
MYCYGDYHTHTTYSHGKGSIEDNAAAAKRAGFKAVAITDHGLGHIIFGLRSKKVVKMRREIEELKTRPEYAGMDILLGVEANITGLKGQIDIKPAQWEWFDVVLCGFHKAAKPASAGDFFRFFARNYFLTRLVKRTNRRVRERNTRAFAELVKKHPVDVITHINYDLQVDCRVIAAVCAEYGTLIEINTKRITYTDKDMRDMIDTGVNFILNSDAHSPERVGEFAMGVRLIERLGIPRDRIVNLSGERPVFRSERERQAKGNTEKS